MRCKPELDGLGALGDLVRPSCLNLVSHANFQAGCSPCKSVKALSVSACPCRSGLLRGCCSPGVLRPGRCRKAYRWLLYLLDCCLCRRPCRLLGLLQGLTADAAALAGLVLHAGIAVGIQLRSALRGASACRCGDLVAEAGRELMLALFFPSMPMQMQCMAMACPVKTSVSGRSLASTASRDKVLCICCSAVCGTLNP